MIISSTSPFAANHWCTQGVFRFAFCPEIRALFWFFQSFHNITTDAFFVFFSNRNLLSYFEGYDTLILIDATLDNNPNGTIRLIKPRFAQDFPKAMSTHDIGLKDMVSALQLMGKMPTIHLFVVSIESLQQQGIELTEEVENAIPSLIDQIKNLLGFIVQEDLKNELVLAD